MIELKRYQLRAPTCPSNAFDFERASVALLSTYQHRGAIALSLPIPTDWRGPVSFQNNTVIQQGVHRHG